MSPRVQARRRARTQYGCVLCGALFAVVACSSTKSTPRESEVTDAGRDAALAMSDADMDASSTPGHEEASVVDSDAQNMDTCAPLVQRCDVDGGSAVRCPSSIRQAIESAGGYHYGTRAYYGCGWTEVEVERFVDGGASSWTFDEAGHLQGQAVSGDEGLQCWGTLLLQHCERSQWTECNINPDYLTTGELCASDDAGADDGGA